MVKRYRVISLREGVESKISLQDRIYTEIAAEKPAHPACHEGEWVCEHSPCPVRGVQLRVKMPYHQHLPLLRCPLCLRTLTFRHWLNIIALQEVAQEAAAEKASRPPHRKKSSRAVAGKSPS